MASPTRAIGKLLFRRALRDNGPGLGPARLLTSTHLQDLQWIVFLTLVITIGLLIWLGVEQLVFTSANAIVDKRTVVTTILTVAIAICNWAYQSGNRRLGTIDLFGCEISTLCRVILVIDFAESAIKQLAAASPEIRPFKGAENYTPVYDQQLADLVPFDLRVVKNVTEFYTYRKMALDYLRARGDAPDVAAFKALSDQMLYMLYLMCESGRQAVRTLIEFDPDQFESIINILCSEFVLFGYLAGQFADDYRGERLILRRKPYDDLIANLRAELASKTDEKEHASWNRAKATWPEVERRYEAMRLAAARIWGDRHQPFLAALPGH